MERTGPASAVRREQSTRWWKEYIQLLKGYVKHTLTLQEAHSSPAPLPLQVKSMRLLTPEDGERQRDGVLLENDGGQQQHQNCMR